MDFATEKVCSINYDHSNFVFISSKTPGNILESAFSISKGEGICDCFAAVQLMKQQLLKLKAMDKAWRHLDCQGSRLVSLLPVFKSNMNSELNLELTTSDAYGHTSHCMR